MQSCLFVSYRRGDVGLARALTELLETLGQVVFLDVKSIRLGQDWNATILQAARAAHTLLVLWSRSAASSSYMQREWAMVGPECRVIPLRLDGSELPPELASRQALDLSVGERLLARMAELRNAGHSNSAINQQLLAELQADGVNLEPRQRKALLGAVAAFGAVSLGPLGWQMRRLLQSTLSPGGALLGASLGLGAWGWEEAHQGNLALAQCELQAAREPIVSLPAPGGSAAAPIVDIQAAKTAEPSAPVDAGTEAPDRVLPPAPRPELPAKLSLVVKPAAPQKLASAQADQRKLLLKNAAGGGSMKVLGTKVTGSSDFTVELGSCGPIVPAGGSCQLVVAFKPTSLETQKATLEITLSPPGKPQSVVLEGLLRCTVPNMGSLQGTAPLGARAKAQTLAEQAGLKSTLDVTQRAGQQEYLYFDGQKPARNTEVPCGSSVTSSVHFDNAPIF